jgi:hypothetical protein
MQPSDMFDENGLFKPLVFEPYKNPKERYYSCTATKTIKATKNAISIIVYGFTKSVKVIPLSSITSFSLDGMFGVRTVRIKTLTESFDFMLSKKDAYDLQDFIF